MRRKLTLNVEDELIDEMKIQCIYEKRDLSTITEELYEKYLGRAERHETAMLAVEKLKRKP